jgi:mycothiol synthase
MGALDGEYRCAVAAIRDARADDVDAIYDLLTARSRAAFGVSQVQWDEVARNLRMDGNESWVAVEDGSVVGHAQLNSAHDLALAAVDPQVNDALLAHAEAAARRRNFDFLTVYAVAEDEPLWALAERSGFAHDRDVLRMWRPLDGDLPRPSWPDDVTVRSFDAADGEHVKALLDASYAGWDDAYAVRPYDDWLAFMTDHDEFDPALWFLVERNAKLVACALHWKEHQRRGWVKDIVVADAERGRGLGKALLHHAFRVYADRGVERVGLKVDSSNPTGAPQLYEKVGFVIDQRLAVWIKRL